MIKAAALVAVALVACSDRDRGSASRGPRKTPYYFEQSDAQLTIDNAYARAGSRPVNFLIMYGVRSDGRFEKGRAAYEVQLFGDPDMTKSDACTLLHADDEQLVTEEDAACVRGHRVIPRPRCSMRDQLRRAGLAGLDSTGILVSLWSEGDPPRTSWHFQESGRPYDVPDDCLPVLEQP